ncbi:MAG: hypothetical protein RR954_09055, partial [Christensenellaceae bacterium]
MCFDFVRHSQYCFLPPVSGPAYSLNESCFCVYSAICFSILKIMQIQTRAIFGEIFTNRCMDLGIEVLLYDSLVFYL